MIQDKIYDALKESAFLYLDDFMNISLRDEEHGYYTSNKAIGKNGDFVTAPEISQTIGEIIGIYLFYIWKTKIKSKFDLIELVPGKGTLFNDNAPLEEIIFFSSIVTPGNEVTSEPVAITIFLAL